MTTSASFHPHSLSPWPALENLGDVAQVTATWESHLGELLPAFAAAFLQRRPELASSYPCPCDCGCVHEVIREGPGEHVAVCRCEPWSCDTFAVSTEELALWELSWARLGRALCAALGLNQRPAELNLACARQIGAWSVAAVPVILALPRDSPDLREAIAELNARLRRPCILLTPTTRQVQAGCLELLANAGAELFDLESNVALTDNGTLRACRIPGELFARFTPAPDEAERSVVERAFALVKALDAERALREPSAVATFSHYCLEGLDVSRIARKFGCSRGTVLNRLELIRRRTGADPDSFRRLSPQIGRIESSLHEPRARRIHRKSAVYGIDEEEEE